MHKAEDARREDLERQDFCKVLGVLVLNETVDFLVLDLERPVVQHFVRRLLIPFVVHFQAERLHSAQHLSLIV